MKRLLVTVSGKDRPGIIAKVSGLLYGKGCNLEDISMTLLEGQFAMMMTVGIPARVSSKALGEAIGELKGPPWSMECFTADLKGKATRGKKHAGGCQPCVITAFGKDRTGIVHEISRTLAAVKANITDLDCRILGRGSQATYGMILEVDAPESVSLKRLMKMMSVVSRKLKIEIRTRPMEPVAF